jgi:hypothetical protein
MDSDQGERIALICVTNCYCREIEKGGGIELEFALFILIVLVARVLGYSTTIPTSIAKQGIISKRDDYCLSIEQLTAPTLDCVSLVAGIIYKLTNYCGSFEV